MQHYSKKQLLKVVFALFLLVFLAAANFSLAAIKFNIEYPELPGVRNILNATSSSGIGTAVAYYLKWFLLLAIFACIISLVWAGIQYVSSTGQTGTMKQARERIFNSFLGLAILIASYLILNTLNPQIMLSKITKPTTPSGSVLLLSKKAYDEFDGSNFGDLKESGDIYFLTNDIRDATNKDDFFGELTDKDPDRSANRVHINFKNFNFYALGFWGEDADYYRVTIFSEKNFGNIDISLHGGNNVHVAPQAYESSGKINLVDGKPFDPATYPDRYVAPKEIAGMKMYKVHTNDINDLGKGQEFYYLNFVYRTDSGGTISDATLRPVPPLSFKIEGVGIGVNLVASEAGATTSLFVPEGVSMSEIPEGLEPIQMKINLEAKTSQGVKTADLITAIFDKPHYQGNVAIYFKVKRDPNDTFGTPLETIGKYFPKIYKSSYYSRQKEKLDLLGILKNQFGLIQRKEETVKGEPPSYSDFTLYKAKFAGLPQEDGALLTFGSPPSPALAPENINRIQQGPNPTGNSKLYGSLRDEPVRSLLQIELSQEPQKCKAVTLCKQKNLGPPCIKFINNDQLIDPTDTGIQTSNTDEDISVALPMPFYQPVNLPKKIGSYVKRQTRNYNTGEFVGDPWWVEVGNGNGFNDSVRSIKVEGQCLVFLFEKRLEWQDDASVVFGGWESSSGDSSWLTGSKSIAIFPGSNNLTGSSYSPSNITANLPDDVIGCGVAGGVLGYFSQGARRGCVSAVAFFPIGSVKTKQATQAPAPSP